MSRNIVIYTDGSGDLVHREVIAWAFVALHDDAAVECTGIKTGAYVQDNHEWCAMVEAYLYAKAHGYLNSEIAVYTDCNDFPDCIFSIQDENRRFVSKDKWINRIKNFLINNGYDYVESDLFIEFLLTARIHKIKSHSFLVYNSRADYLAKNTLRMHIRQGTPSKIVIKDFPSWTKKAGFFIPFSNESQVRDVA